MKRLWWGAALLGAVLAVSGCRSAMDSAYEKVRVYKRDLLKKRVAAARDQQKQAQQVFKDTLTRLKQIAAVGDTMR